MTIYIVENHDTCEFEAFEELKQAAAYIRKYYIDHLKDLFSGYHNDVDSVLQLIKDVLENLEAEYPFIQDTMYIYKATLHN